MQINHRFLAVERRIWPQTYMYTTNSSKRKRNQSYNLLTDSSHTVTCLSMTTHSCNTKQVSFEYRTEDLINGKLLSRRTWTDCIRKQWLVIQLSVITVRCIRTWWRYTNTHMLPFPFAPSIHKLKIKTLLKWSHFRLLDTQRSRWILIISMD